MVHRGIGLCSVWASGPRAIGVAIGVAASAALVRFLATLLLGVPPLDPLTFAVAPLALTAIAMLACLAPAIRALRADPIAALRAE